MNTWQPINFCPIDRLIICRKQLHQAVQLPSAFARNILPKDPSDASASLSWSPKIGGLKSNSTKDGNIGVALVVADFELIILQGDRRLAALNLHNRSVHEGLQWLKSEVSSLGLPGENINLELPYEIEVYDYTMRLSKDEGALKTLASMFSDADQLFKEIEQREKHAEQVRCWPHHFDLATLLPQKFDAAGELLQSVGVGMSPGDDATPEPYIYVNIWPNVDYDQLANHALEQGYWNESDWSGAVLKYSDFVDGNQQEVIERFLTSTIGFLKKQ